MNEAGVADLGCLEIFRNEILRCEFMHIFIPVSLESLVGQSSSMFYSQKCVGDITFLHQYLYGSLSGGSFVSLVSSTSFGGVERELSSAK